MDLFSALTSSPPPGTWVACSRDQWLLAVLRSYQLTPTARAVAGVLAAHMNPSGASGFDAPLSHREIAGRAALGECVVRVALGELEAEGWLWTERRDGRVAYQGVPAELRAPAFPAVF